MSTIVDITDIFWPLVEGIVLLDYDALRRTRFFEVMSRHMLNETAFHLDICGARLYHANVNELFYGTREYLSMLDEHDKHQVLDAAIRKMERTMETDAACAGMAALQLSAVDGLNAVLAKLELSA